MRRGRTKTAGGFMKCQQKVVHVHARVLVGVVVGVPVASPAAAYFFRLLFLIYSSLKLIFIAWCLDEFLYVAPLTYNVGDNSSSAVACPRLHCCLYSSAAGASHLSYAAAYGSHGARSTQHRDTP